MEAIIQIVGFLMIWFAVDIGRGPESKVKMFSGDWWIMFGLITVGAILTSFEINPT